MLKLNHLTGFGSGAAAAGGDVTSYVFDGTGDYLSIPDHADWDFQSSNFTIEAFVRIPDNTPSNDSCIYSQWVDDNNHNRFYISTTGRIAFEVRESGTTEVSVLSATAALTSNTWHHVAVVRQSDTYYLYLDGTDVTSYGGSDSFDAAALAGDVYIGARGDESFDFNGYMDEVRVSDTARYPDGTTFTPSTTQFVSDANTLLLIHGGEAYTAPLTGETTQSCVTLDGTGDYLSVPDHADWEFGAGEFTVDFWINTTQTGTADRFMGRWGAGGKRTFALQFGSDNKLHCYYSDDGDYSATFQIEENDANTINDGAWHHVAVTGNTTDNLVKMFIDGTVQTDTEAMTTIFANDLSWLIGDAGLGESINANLSEIRILKGAAAWTTSFTPSTTRYTSDANTVLLIHGDENGGGTTAFTDSGNTGHTVTPTGNAFLGNGGTFTDSGNTGHTVSENGQAQKETEQEFKFADDGVGYYFDGTGGDNLSIPDHADWDLTGDFTLELWVKHVDHVGSERYISVYEDGDNYFTFCHQHGSGLEYYWRNDGGTAFSIISALEITDTDWHFAQVVKDGANTEIYLDGVQGADGDTTDTDLTLTATLYIGTLQGSDDLLQGNVDEIRISDTARGTSVPTSQFTSDANTKLLIHGGEAKSGTTGSGATFTDSGNTGHTVTENGNAIESTGNLYKF